MRFWSWLPLILFAVALNPPPPACMHMCARLCAHTHTCMHATRTCWPVRKRMQSGPRVHAWASRTKAAFLPPLTPLVQLCVHSLLTALTYPLHLTTSHSPRAFCSGAAFLFLEYPSFSPISLPLDMWLSPPRIPPAPPLPTGPTNT